MRGIPDFNFPAFHHAAFDLRRQGYVVFSPAESSHEAEWAAAQGPSYDSTLGVAGPQAATLRYFMQVDLPEVLRCDAVAILDGWHQSVGCQIETYVAFACGIPVKAYEEGIPLADAYEFNRYAHPHITRPV